MSKNDYSLDISPARYLNDAIQLSAHHHPLEALNYMDLAITLAPDKHTYIFKKIEFLYQFNLYSQCTDYIILHFAYLYVQSTLTEFAKILAYYYECTQCLTEELNHLLLSHALPIILSTVYPELLRTDSLNTLNFTTDAQLCYADLEYSLCTEYATLAIKQSGDTLDMWKLKALAHEALGQLDQATISYKKAITLSDPNTLAPLYFSLAKTLEHAKLFSDAHFYYTQALTLEPNTLHYYTSAADCLFAWGKKAVARRSFRLITKYFPSDPYSYLRLGELYEILDNKRLSHYYYKQASRLKNNKAATIGLRGKFLGI